MAKENEKKIMPSQQNVQHKTNEAVSNPTQPHQTI